MILLIQVLLLTAVTWQANNVTDDWFFSLSFGVVAMLAIGATNAAHKLNFNLRMHVWESREVLKAIEQVNKAIMEEIGLTEDEMEQFDIPQIVKRNNEDFYNSE